MDTVYIFYSDTEILQGESKETVFLFIFRKNIYPRLDGQVLIRLEEEMR